MAKIDIDLSKLSFYFAEFYETIFEVASMIQHDCHANKSLDKILYNLEVLSQQLHRELKGFYFAAGFICK